MGSFPGHCEGKFYAGVMIAPFCINIRAVVRLKVVQLILFIVSGNRRIFDDGVRAFAELKCQTFACIDCWSFVILCIKNCHLCKFVPVPVF